MGMDRNISNNISDAIFSNDFLITLGLTEKARVEQLNNYVYNYQEGVELETAVKDRFLFFGH